MIKFLFEAQINFKRDLLDFFTVGSTRLNPDPFSDTN